MAIFKERKTLIENIAFMAIISAINIVLSTLASLFIIPGLFIIIFLPFLSAVVAITCRWKFYPIYSFASIGLSLVCTLWNMQFTIFYLIPSIITGFLFGLCFRKNLPPIYSLLLTSLAHLILTCCFIPLINILFNTDLIKMFIVAFKLENKENIKYIILSFIYLMSLIQMVFSFIVLNNEINKFVTYDYKENGFLIKIISMLFSILVIPFSFFALSFAYLFMFISLFISTFLFIELINTKRKILIILSIISALIGIILFTSCFSILKMPYALLLLNSSNIFLIIISLVYNHKSIC